MDFTAAWLTVRVVLVMVLGGPTSWLRIHSDQVFIWRDEQSVFSSRCKGPETGGRTLNQPKLNSIGLVAD